MLTTRDFVAGSRFTRWPTRLNSTPHRGYRRISNPALSDGEFDTDQLNELMAAMTAVEGYAELLMDRAFDDEYADLREKVDARRSSGGPLRQLMSRLLGLKLKRDQYERGAAFFAAVADRRDLAAASAVWETADNLPTDDELDAPEQWLQRVDP